MIMCLLFIVLFLLTLLIVRWLRHAPGSKAMHPRLAGVTSVLVQTLSGSRPPDVFVTDRVAAHRLLVRGCAGGAFSSRPPSSVPSAVLSRHRHYNLNSVPYGRLWRTLRRNLTSEVLHPAGLRRYAAARSRALRGLVADLHEQCASNSGVVLAAESMRAAMFGLLAAMCFGDGVDEGLVGAMADAQDDLVQCFFGLKVFSTLPTVSRLIYRRRWSKLVTLRRQQEEMYLPLIDARPRRRRRSGELEPPAYVDTLIDLRVPADDEASSGGRARKRRLTDGELVGLCSEFLGAGTEPGAAVLQWIMANLVKRLDVQEALWREIDAAVGADAEEVSEEVLGRLEHLNAVVMEGLRLYPAVPMVLRQVMASDDHVVLDGRRIPAGTAVHFPLARLARDTTAWADPSEFRPERFLAGGEGEGVGLVSAAGSAGAVRMMPFGAGRRMCQGMGVAVLHLGYLVANLVREFRWAEADGDLAVDLRPHIGLFAVMKRPLRARLERRRPGEARKRACDS